MSHLSRVHTQKVICGFLAHLASWEILTFPFFGPTQPPEAQLVSLVLEISPVYSCD